MSDDDARIPRNDAAEKLLIGAIVSFPKVADDAFRRIHARDFFGKPHQAIYAKMLDQHRRGLAVDPPWIGAELQGHPDFPELKVCAYLLELGHEVRTIRNVDCYIKEVRNASLKRRMFFAFNSAADETQNGKALDEILRTFRADFEEYEREAATDKPRDKYTIGQLQADFPNLNRPIIEGLARAGEVVNIISYTKVGKSWLLGSLILSNIMRSPWLNKFQTFGGRVLLIDNELHKPTIAFRIRTIAEAMGIPQDLYAEDLVVRPYRGLGKTWPDVWADLAGIQPGEFSLIAVDSKYRFAIPGSSENDNVGESRIYDGVACIADRAEAAFALIHHATKGIQSDKRVTDVGSGAGSQSRAADTHIVIRDHEDDGVAVLEAGLRSFAPVEPLALRWTFPLWLPADGVDPQRLKRQPTRNDQRQASSDREGMETTIKALRGGPSTARNIRSKTAFGEYRQQRLLDLLTSQGRAIFSDKNIGGKTYREYSLVD